MCDARHREKSYALFPIRIARHMFLIDQETFITIFALQRVALVLVGKVRLVRRSFR